MNSKKKKAAALSGLLGAAVIASGCGSGAVQWVNATDPALLVCQQPSITGISDLQQAVDNANNTNPLNGRSGQQLSDDQVKKLKTAIPLYRKFAGEVTGHPALATALLNEAVQFGIAAYSADGLTTNSVAIATDKFAGEVTSNCDSFRVGTAPKAQKPGPGAWNWDAFWSVLAGYAAMVFACSYMIAVAERAKPKSKRNGPGAIFTASLFWPGTIFIYAGKWWGQVLSAAQVTPDEKAEARRKAVLTRNAALEAENTELLAQVERLNGDS